MTSNTELLNLVMQSLEDAKAEDIVSLNVKDKATFTDTMIFATGNSTRHVNAIANAVSVDAKHAGFEVLGAEGKNNAEWVLVDLNDLVLHIMLEKVRDFYQLEKLWQADNPDVQAL